MSKNLIVKIMKNKIHKNKTCNLSSAICELSNYELVIGLEIHVELCTLSKMFCKCSADHFEKEPNSQTCPVCLGLPGALPVPNRKAIEWTVMIATALNCKIRHSFKFDRKHYFYPDLPKGFQISQYDQPIGSNGYLEINGKEYGIERVHLEEDTAKLNKYENETLIDFNRSGVPLVEIVTKPNFRDGDTVKEFLEELYWIVKYLGVSSADMEKGNMRLEPNISVRKIGQKELPKYKVELKNINSFKYVKDAIEYEYKRQIEILEKGETPKQETRGYDSKKKVTYSQRSKESASDYRYFPEPDIPPIELSDTEIKSITMQMLELPYERKERYINDYEINEINADRFVKDQKLAETFEIIMAKSRTHNDLPNDWGNIIANAIINKRVNIKLSPDKIIAETIKLNAPKKVDTNAIESIVDKVIEQNKDKINEMKVDEKQKILMFLVGQIRYKCEEKEITFEFNEVRKLIESKL